MNWWYYFIQFEYLCPVKDLESLHVLWYSVCHTKFMKTVLGKNSHFYQEIVFQWLMGRHPDWPLEKSTRMERFHMFYCYIDKNV